MTGNGAYWLSVATKAESVAQGDNPADIAAVMAACSMADAIYGGRRIPFPTPELNARLAHAEVLAQKA